MAELESLSATEPLAIGDRVLDRYRVIERIAAGGHSIVYRGEDERLSRPICIKVFYKLGAEAGVRRTSYEHFVQEAFALSRLTHPNTLRIYDFGHLEAAGDEEVGAPFQVSEFMNGGTLARAIRTEGAMAAAEAVRVVSALCGALAEAHDCGIVHRDIKPKNILFGRAGPTRIPKLADFGIAKSIPVEHELLQNRAGDTEVVAGQRLVMYSPSWAAPEQLTGDPVQPSADIYSMALVTIYMLTGQVVFPAENLDEAYRKRSLSDELIDVAITSADLPAAAAALLKQACTFDRRGRPPGISAFADALAQAFGAGAPPPTRAPSPELSTVPVERVEMPSGAVSTPLRRIRRDDPATVIAGRRVIFVPARDGTAELFCGGGARVRLTFFPSARGGPSVHIKGQTCFVSLAGGRPTAAVGLQGGGALELLLPNHQVVARGDLIFGKPAAGHTVFHIGSESVAVTTDECPGVVALDFGRDADCFFVFTPPVTEAPPSGRSRRRKNGKPAT